MANPEDIGKVCKLIWFAIDKYMEGLASDSDRALATKEEMLATGGIRTGMFRDFEPSLYKIDDFDLKVKRLNNLYALNDIICKR